MKTPIFKIILESIFIILLFFLIIVAFIIGNYFIGTFLGVLCIFDIVLKLHNYFLLKKRNQNKEIKND